MKNAAAVRPAAINSTLPLTQQTALEHMDRTVFINNWRDKDNNRTVCAAGNITHIYI